MKEDQHIEWKLSWRDEYLKWICGFANAYGGLLVIGRDDSGYFESNVDLRYQDEVHGDLLSQVSQTIEILKAKYFKALISFDKLQRIESYPLPDAVLREALLNAVVHKDYASANPVQISVYPDKFIIWNPGRLPQDWTVERLLSKHSSQPFNPDIANTFFRAGMIEA